MAAFCVGPKSNSPRAWKASAIPSTRGASGPTRVRSMPSARAQSARASTSPFQGTSSARASIPAFPGAA